MSDIVLVYPKTGGDMKRAIAPPHSLLAIAALPDKEGMTVKIIDQRVEPNWENMLKEELKQKPLCVGISSMTGMQIKYAIEVAKKIRELSKVPIVWGGKHPSLMPVQVLESGYADAVCVGEGDYQFYYNILGKKFWGVWRTSKYVDMEELLPTPWHLINVGKYIHEDIYLSNSPRTLDIGESSRGCLFRCSFCSQANTKWRPISASKVIDKVTEMVKKYNLTGIWFRDDEFFINVDRAVEISEALMPLKIKWYTSGTRIDIFNKTPIDACKIYKMGGASVLKFGAENANERILKLIKKGFTKEDIIKANLKCKEVGIIPAYNFMGGFPSQTFEEFDETIDLIRQMKKDNPDARFETIMTYAPMPGTQMWDMALEYGLKPPETLEGWTNWRFDEEDKSGTRNPWYSKKERVWIGNIVYLTALTYVSETMIDSYGNGIKGSLLKSAYWLPKKYFSFRLNHKLYRNAPELQFFKWLRGKMFGEMEEN